MYRIIFVFIFLSYSITISSQQEIKDQPYLHSNKGKFYAYWGWNWDWFGHSDIRFQGAGYDFTILDAVAKDRQSGFDLETYFGLGNFTTPQYNFRFGYYWNDRWSVSIGTDHMKYVFKLNQVANISGYINNTGTIYDGSYEVTPTVISRDLIIFEHTDGLNYGNIEVRRHDQLWDLGVVKINTLAGAGAGILLPRTNATVLNNDRWDEFHLSGYGVSGVLGINIAIGKRFFAQTEFKSGYINMPDIRTTSTKSDKASQGFMFYQYNIVFGATIGKGN